MGLSITMTAIVRCQSRVCSYSERGEKAAPGAAHKDCSMLGSIHYGWFRVEEVLKFKGRPLFRVLSVRRL